MRGTWRRHQKAEFSESPNGLQITSAKKMIAQTARNSQICAMNNKSNGGFRISSSFAGATGFCLILVWLQTTAALAAGSLSLHFVSDAPEPYSGISTGGFSGPPVAESPDPLVTYRWPAPKAADGLETYALKPEFLQAEAPKSFSNLSSLKGEHPDVTVQGVGSIRMDFGQENAGWLEFDSPDLIGKVEMSISEYNEPAVVNAGRANPVKTAAPRRYGNTYRLELNKDLYEGVRFGWIHIRSFSKPWHITGLRLVCQTKPANYTGSFSCSDPELTRIWYAGAYTVKLNLLRNYFGAILMDRGDRISWTGDAYVAQAASLAAFGNFAFVKTNLVNTSSEANGIPSYALYWVLSLVDYYNYSGDATALDQFLTNACNRLDEVYVNYDHPPNLVFYGWDERLGAGFENPNLPEVRRAYAMLAIRTWREFARTMEQHGRPDLSVKYGRYADEKIAQLRLDRAWVKAFGLHSTADAIDAGFTTPAEQDSLCAKNFSDPVRCLSYSPFNQYFIIQAMSAAGRIDEALRAVKDDWGGQLRLGGTTFFELYDPSWNLVLGRNDPVPNAQCGCTSLCHPWGSGVVKWLTEEILGIKPASPGFDAYVVRPHLGRNLTRVSGGVQTPHGVIFASFDTAKGSCKLTAPHGTTGELWIPEVGKSILSVQINGKKAWDKNRGHSITGMGGIAERDDFLCFTGVQPGTYAIEVSYHGSTPKPAASAWDYPVKMVTQDVSTMGNWGGKYGHDGFVLCNYDAMGGRFADRRKLPAYVSAVKYSLNANEHWQSATMDPRAPAADSSNGYPRNVGCVYTQNPLETMTVDVDMKAPGPHQIVLYFIDWDKKNRRLAVEMFDRDTLDRIAPVQLVSNFENGKYLVLTCDKSVRFRIDRVRGDNATLSGILFEPVHQTTHSTLPSR